MERSVTPIPLHKMRRQLDQPERTEEPLDPGPPVEQARPVDGLQSLGLALWREAHTRWPYALILGLGLILGTALPGEFGHYADVGVAWLIPILAVVLGAGDHARREAFWRGLGGPAGARASGRMLGHALLLGIPWAISTGRLLIQEDDQLGLVLGGLALLAYASTSAMRLLIASVLGRIAAAGGLALLLIGATALSLKLRVWSLVGGLEVRAWAVIAVGLAASLLLERRLGPLGAGMRRAGRWPLAAGLALALLGPAVVEAAWQKPADGSLVLVDAEGDTALLKPFYSGEIDDMLSQGGRLWLWQDGELTRLPIYDVDDAWLGPEGQVVYSKFEEPLVPDTSRMQTVLWRPDGSTVECQGRPWTGLSGPGCEEVQAIAEWPRVHEFELPDGNLRSFDWNEIVDITPEGEVLRTWETPYLFESSL